MSMIHLPLAFLAWFRKRPLPRLITGMSLVCALMLSGLMAWTANLGGQIRHTEICADGPQPMTRAP